MRQAMKIKDEKIARGCPKCKEESLMSEEKRACTPVFEVMATPFNTGPSDCENESIDI
jgi:hypothetical protein